MEEKPAIKRAHSGGIPNLVATGVREFKGLAPAMFLSVGILISCVLPPIFPHSPSLPCFY